eukprot:scaffold8010_cov81-Skeletonema_marinoi.AAC.2
MMFMAKLLITLLFSHRPGFRVLRLSNSTPVALRLKERSGSVAVDDSEAKGCDRPSGPREDAAKRSPGNQ